MSPWCRTGCTTEPRFQSSMPGEPQPLLPPKSAGTSNLGPRPWRRDPSRFRQVVMQWAAKAGLSCEVPTHTVPRLFGGVVNAVGDAHPCVECDTWSGESHVTRRIVTVLPDLLRRF